MTTTVTNSITLQPGEEFILPPKATLIGATDINSISSTCGMTSVESLGCYVIPIGLSDHDDPVNLWNADGSRLLGWSVNGTDYDDVSIQAGSAGAFTTSLIAQPLMNSAKSHGLFISELVVGNNAGDGSRGAYSWIVFKTLPSIAKVLSLKLLTYAPIGNPGPIYAYVKTYDYSQYSTQPNIPPCTTSAKTSGSSTILT